MGERQRRFREMYPDAHASVCEFFPDFDYRNPVPGAIVSMKDPKNCTGHQQRAFTVWWAIEKCGPLDLGLDVGSHRGLSPFAIHIDSMYNGVNQHPIYGGVASADVVTDGARLDMFPPSTFPCIISSHSLEHMHDPVAVLWRWRELLRPGGIIAMIVPDNDYWDVLRSDPDHKWAAGHSDFPRRVLDPFLAKGGSRLVQYDTLKNNFSFDVVLEKTS